MSNPSLASRRFDSTFLYVLLLTGFFLLLEISFFTQVYRTYLSDLSFISATIQIPWRIFPGIAFFIFAQLILHLCYTIIVFICAKSIISLFNIPSPHRFELVVAIWTTGIISILVANQHYYPNSQFASLTRVFLFNPFLAETAFLFICCVCATIGGLCLIGWLKSMICYPEYLASALFAACLGGILFLFLKDDTRPLPRGTRKQPNIIIIGVDSLRPDFLGYFGSDTRTPFFDSFLNHATVFSETITPLARTFPSWIGILTGNYPKVTGARSNLISQTKMNFAEALPKILQQQGYETIYATDETRFSNIDENYGFDRIVGPPMGLNDFLLGTFNDFPLSNLVINSRLGKWLFPYSYANRAVFTTYNPNSFVNLLDEAIHEKNPKPLFLITHFCLPHFPYLWASLAGSDYLPFARYTETITRVDEQAGAFFSLLDQKKLLDHAIVVILSDHGEALEMPGDRLTEKEWYLPAKTPPHFYPPSLADESLNQSAGHGTDVLGMSQYHTVLAFKLYGAGKQRIRIVPGLVSTLDIQPTILKLLNLPATPTAGKSLVTAIAGGALPKEKRHLFLESDYSPEAMRTVFPEVHKVMLESVELFTVDSQTTRLLVKPEMVDRIIKSKQYADIYGDWMLALYPQSENKYIPILINLSSGKWTDDLHSDFATLSPVRDMLAQLQSFYGAEIAYR